MRSDPIFLANQLVLAGQNKMAADLLQGALMSEPRREDIRRSLEQLLEKLAPDEAREVRERQRRFNALAVPEVRGIQNWQLLLAFATFLLVPGLILVKFGFGFWLMDFAVMSTGALVIVVLSLRWRRRLPLRYRGSELSHATRPRSYHLCTLALIVFAMIFLMSGILATIAHIE